MLCGPGNGVAGNGRPYRGTHLIAARPNSRPSGAFSAPVHQLGRTPLAAIGWPSSEICLRFQWREVSVLDQLSSLHLIVSRVYGRPNTSVLTMINLVRPALHPYTDPEAAIAG